MKAGMFGTDEPLLLALWDRLLRVQAAVTIGFELPAYFTSPVWQRAGRVLDLGTGNGCYLAQLASYFPEKQYLGVDLSPELIEIARRSQSAGRIEFQCLDLFDVSGTYDFIILRAVVQHLPDHDRVVAQLARLLASGGSVLVSDSDIDGLFFWPSVPALTALYSRLDESQRRRCGSPGKVLDHFIARLEPSSELRVTAARRIIVPSTVGGSLSQIREQCTLAIELLERTGSAEVAGLREEWEAWCRTPTAYVQFGMELIEVHRVQQPTKSVAGA